MYLEIIIALILVLSVLGIWLWFFKKNGALLYLHNQNILDLESKISKNRFQINSRNSNLSKYHFLKYNLNEALVRQMEI
ncbi:hypothetical protein [Aequorivita capsosiphonis]|uniref:hypothetical protein n=1 Tax=Aequorivita capsosiphonis TaxID=487317 RepID=UPI00041E0B68|nr:hypothetical protein [Aequorivita capsosiphonis]